MTRSLGVGAFLERFEQTRDPRVFSVCRGETLEKRPRSYLVKVVSRRDDDFPRRRIKELSMTMTFRPMFKPMTLGDDRVIRLTTRAAQVRAALRSVFTTRGAEEQYLSQATDLADLEQRLRCAERGQAPYQRSLTFHTYS